MVSTDERRLVTDGSRSTGLGPLRAKHGVRSAAGFRSRNLRHYFAILLTAVDLDVKFVRARLRHASA